MSDNEIEQLKTRLEELEKDHKKLKNAVLKIANSVEILYKMKSRRQPEKDIFDILF